MVGLVFGVDLLVWDIVIVGGMVLMNVGGLCMVCYGNMGEQVVGLDVVLFDGMVLCWYSWVCCDNIGYDLFVLFVRVEGILGVIIVLDLWLYFILLYWVIVVCGFVELVVLVDVG